MIEQHTGKPVDRKTYLQVMEEAIDFYDQIARSDTGFAM
jgi:hypothetical protein